MNRVIKGGTRRNALGRKAAQEFAEGAVRELNGEIQAVVLYGSVARGEATSESDIDLFILTPHPDRIGKKVAEIRADINAKHGYRTLLSPYPMTVDHTWHLVKIGSPYIRDVLDEGVILYEDGSFSRIRQEVLATYGSFAAMRPTPEFARMHFELADQMLADARSMLQSRGLRSAADRAYYAMFHAATAALSQEAERLPRTHSGLQTLFNTHFVVTNRLPKSLFDDLTSAFGLRQESTYGVGATADEAVVRETMDKAEAFVAAMRQLLGMEGRP